VPRYAALLRGINVGGRTRVPMADLRALLGGLGYTGVATHLQSGNAVFTASGGAAALERAIARGIRDTFGLDVDCLVRNRAQIRAVVADNPLADAATDGSRMLAVFLSRQPSAALLTEHDPAALDPGRIRVGDRVVYQWCPDGFRDAPGVGPFVEKRLGVRATARNWNTVTRLAAMLDG
jgi:uncharacterized protein (DUF1697 family)